MGLLTVFISCSRDKVSHRLTHEEDHLKRRNLKRKLSLDQSYLVILLVSQ